MPAAKRAQVFVRPVSCVSMCVRLFAPAVSVTVSLDAVEMTPLARSAVLALDSSEREGERETQTEIHC